MQFIKRTFKEIFISICFALVFETKKKKLKLLIL